MWIISHLLPSDFYGKLKTRTDILLDYYSYDNNEICIGLMEATVVLVGLY